MLPNNPALLGMLATVLSGTMAVPEKVKSHSRPQAGVKTRRKARKEQKAARRQGRKK